MYRLTTSFIKNVGIFPFLVCVGGGGGCKYSLAKDSRNIQMVYSYILERHF